MFSATVKASKSEKCWNTMPMPSLRAAAGLVIETALALPAEFAGGGLQRAIDHLDEGRLAGPVLAEEGMDFAGLDPQRHIVIGPQGAEHLDDVKGLEEILRIGLHSAPRFLSATWHIFCGLAGPQLFVKHEELRRRGGGNHRRLLGADAGTPIGQINPSIRASATCRLAQALHEAGALGGAADQSDMGDARVAQRLHR